VNPLSIVVRTGCDVFAWFMIIFGVNIVLHGYATPGGGFQGGAVVATFMALLLVGYGGKKVLSWANEKMYEFFFDDIGLLAFIALAFLGFPRTFFYNFLARPLTEAVSGVLPGVGTIEFMSVAVGLEVTGALTLIVLTMYKGIRLFGETPPEGEFGHDR